MKQIVLTVKTENLIEVIKNLKLTEDFVKNTALTINLDIEETKSNFEYLINSDKILDWDFVKEKEEVINQKDENNYNNPETRNEIESAVNYVKNRLKEEEERKNQEDILKSINYVKHLIQSHLNSNEDLFHLIIYVWEYLRTNSSNKNLTPKFDNSTIYTEYVIPQLSKNIEECPQDHPFIMFLDQYYKECEINVILSDILYKLYTNWDKISKAKKVDDLFNILKITINE